MKSFTLALSTGVDELPPGSDASPVPCADAATCDPFKPYKSMAGSITATATKDHVEISGSFDGFPIGAGGWHVHVGTDCNDALTATGAGVQSGSGFTQKGQVVGTERVSGGNVAVAEGVPTRGSGGDSSNADFCDATVCQDNFAATLIPGDAAYDPAVGQENKICGIMNAGHYYNSCKKKQADDPWGDAKWATANGKGSVHYKLTKTQLGIDPRTVLFKSGATGLSPTDGRCLVFHALYTWGQVASGGGVPQDPNTKVAVCKFDKLTVY